MKVEVASSQVNSFDYDCVQGHNGLGSLYCRIRHLRNCDDAIGFEQIDVTRGSIADCSGCESQCRFCWLSEALRKRIRQINGALVEVMENEETILCPQVAGRIERYGLDPYVSHLSSNVPDRLI